MQKSQSTDCKPASLTGFGLSRPWLQYPILNFGIFQEAPPHRIRCASQKQQKAEGKNRLHSCLLSFFHLATRKQIAAGSINRHPRVRRGSNRQSVRGRWPTDEMPIHLAPAAPCQLLCFSSLSLAPYHKIFQRALTCPASAKPLEIDLSDRHEQMATLCTAVSTSRAR